MNFPRRVGELDSACALSAKKLAWPSKPERPLESGSVVLTRPVPPGTGETVQLGELAVHVGGARVEELAKVVVAVHRHVVENVQRLAPHRRAERGAHLRIDRRELGQIVEIREMKQLAEVALCRIVRPRRREQALGFGAQALVGGELARRRGIEQRIVGGGVPQEVREARGELVALKDSP